MTRFYNPDAEAQARRLRRMEAKVGGSKEFDRLMGEKYKIEVILQKGKAVLVMIGDKYHYVTRLEAAKLRDSRK